MKLMFIVGAAAVGKMTVGQELTKITPFKLFHNHMTIEPVIELFDDYNTEVVGRLRDVVFEEFAKSNSYGLIFTYLMAFEMPSEWQYIAHVKQIFDKYNAEFYFVELSAPLDVRRQRNVTSNRLANKPSKRDIAASDARLLADETRHRVCSLEGEVKYENYLKIDNSTLTAAETAALIKTHFKL